MVNSIPANYRIYQALWSGLDWLLPPRCAGCGKRGYRFCPECQEATTIIGDEHCECCGRPLKPAGLCGPCQKRRPAFTQARGWGIHEGRLRDAIHNLKYRRDVGLGEVLSRQMIEVLSHLDWDLDIVLPVPLAPNRLRERGYNQSALLARPIALRLGLPYRPNLVRRVRETRSQVGLSRPERYQNVAGAFKADPDQVSGMSVLLVDDVTTTGATLEAVVEALRQAGAKEVYAITLARAAGLNSS